jgi:hypothetical protein
MRNIKDLLKLAEKKNKKHYEPSSKGTEEIEQAYSSNCLNMKTVKEGTAVAGAFCNRIMEVADNCADISMIEARTISDIFQRIALDSKHDGTGGSFKDSDWYRISEMLSKTKRNTSLEHIESELKKILCDAVTAVEVSTDDDLDINNTPF